MRRKDPGIFTPETNRTMRSNPRKPGKTGIYKEVVVPRLDNTQFLGGPAPPRKKFTPVPSESVKKPPRKKKEP